MAHSLSLGYEPEPAQPAPGNTRFPGIPRQDLGFLDSSGCSKPECRRHKRPQSTKAKSSGHVTPLRSNHARQFSSGANRSLPELRSAATGGCSGITPRQALRSAAVRCNIPSLGKPKNGQMYNSPGGIHSSVLCQFDGNRTARIRQTSCGETGIPRRRKSTSRQSSFHLARTC